MQALLEVHDLIVRSKYVCTTISIEHPAIYGVNKCIISIYPLDDRQDDAIDIMYDLTWTKGDAGENLSSSCVRYESKKDINAAFKGAKSQRGNIRMTRRIGTDVQQNCSIMQASCRHGHGKQKLYTRLFEEGGLKVRRDGSPKVGL